MMNLNSNLPVLISLEIHATLLLHFSSLSYMSREKWYYQIYILNVVYFMLYLFSTNKICIFILVLCIFSTNKIHISYFSTKNITIF